MYLKCIVLILDIRGIQDLDIVESVDINFILGSMGLYGKKDENSSFNQVVFKFCVFIFCIDS